MKRMGMLILAGVAALGLVACERQDPMATNQKLDQIMDRLGKIEQQLQQGAGAARPQQRPERPPGPDASKVYAVPVEGAPSVGPANAKVTIVKAYEYACGFCFKVNATLDQLKKDYGDDVRIVYKNFIVHPDVATVPAQAACAAHQQGKFKEMSALIWEKGFQTRQLSAENMEALAKEAGLDIAKYKAAVDGQECKQHVQNDHATMAKFGVRGTPAFYINGRFLSGAQPIHAFKQIIDEELKKANERIEKGAKAEEYYNKFVIEQGAKNM